MKLPLQSRRRAQAGQSLVFIVLFLAGVGFPATALVIDGGNAWEKQRQAQNGADSAALAGAVVLTKYYACRSLPGGLAVGCVIPYGSLTWGGAVWEAIVDAAGDNGVTASGAVYTDADGVPLSPATAVGPGLIPLDAAGVQVQAQLVVDTMLVGAFGIETFTLGTLAAAKAGHVQGYCATSDGCLVLPLAIPNQQYTCDGSGNAVSSGAPWPQDVVVVIPICKHDPGNVGWICWDGKAQCDEASIWFSIVQPDNDPLIVPVDVSVKPGNMVSFMEPALRYYDGQMVRLALTSGSNSAGGANVEYTLVEIAYFQFCGGGVGIPGCTPHGSYGNDPDTCGTGNGSTGCLVGVFRDMPISEPGGAGDPESFGVQLVR